ncbi:MAG: hypothetical protein Q8O43_02850 [Dehalococcoidia bacterium]|nr:hypothetical protein [Dehalococcoidia bacterium]
MDTLQQVLDYITRGIGLLAGLIIIYGVLLGVAELFRVEWHRFQTQKVEKLLTF